MTRVRFGGDHVTYDGTWLHCPDISVLVVEIVGVEDVHHHDHIAGDPESQRTRKRTRIHYKDGRIFETMASRRDIFAAIHHHEDDAVIVSFTVGKPQEVPEDTETKTKKDKHK